MQSVACTVIHIILRMGTPAPCLTAQLGNRYHSSQWVVCGAKRMVHRVHGWASGVARCEVRYVGCRTYLKVGWCITHPYPVVPPVVGTPGGTGVVWAYQWVPGVVP